VFAWAELDPGTASDVLNRDESWVEAKTPSASTTTQPTTMARRQ